jgi:hypothetical protein
MCRLCQYVFAQHGVYACFCDGCALLVGKLSYNASWGWGGLEQHSMHEAGETVASRSPTLWISQLRVVC